LAIKPKPGRGNGKWEKEQEQAHSRGKPGDTDTRAETGVANETGAGCQDIEQAAVCRLATARQGSDT